ncbi:MAG: aminotransferase class I/II-fold pyridoxal phosphate-dependent enzyme [Firmicutes bacterium]|nr:aminotransferase class I/II-fold pyridoxal phosphate-dependent enzyme [Bacillota bacterium]
MRALVDSINILGKFLGVRDVPELTQESLEETYHFKQADVMVLFGGAILAGGDVLAEAIKAQVAKTYIIVGGYGHTTETLRTKMKEDLPGLSEETATEAELYDAYLHTHYGLRADYLETKSTNCGNNITNLLDLMKAHEIACSSIILCQDASMQRRMEAGMRGYRPDLTIINFAAYQAEAAEQDSRVVFRTPIHGMWDLDRYIELLMGEIPRLRDDENGYGPKGKGFIAHVDIPEEAAQAFEYLKTMYAVRDANPAFAADYSDEFEQEVSRAGIGNMKGEMALQLQKNGIADPIFLSGAEMDYQTATCIRRRLADFAGRGLYGFTLPDQDYQDAVCWWMGHVRAATIQPEWILPMQGTTFALSSVVRALTRPGEKVLLQSPSYYRFDRAILRNHRQVIYSPLKLSEGCNLSEDNHFSEDKQRFKDNKRSEEYKFPGDNQPSEDNKRPEDSFPPTESYQIDWPDLEAKMRDPACRLMVLVNPHNPTGKVFPASDLERIRDLANQHHVTIFSDEIFAETAQPGHECKSYIAVDPSGISCTSLGKAFNLTGVGQANLIVPDPELRAKLQTQRDIDHFGSIDPFFYQALLSAYTPEGAEWIRQMNIHTKENASLIDTFLKEHMPKLKLCPVEGTFIGWIDCRALGLTDAALQEFFESAGIYADPGIEYGPEGSGFYRWNLAAPKQKIQRALNALRKRHFQKGVG